MRPADVHDASRHAYRNSVANFTEAASDTPGLSSIAVALLAIEVQFARFNDAMEEFLQMAKDETSDV